MGEHDEPRRPERSARTEPHAHRAEVTAFPSRRRRAAGTGRHTRDDPPELVADIHTHDGADADRLALQQARAIREVTEWLAHNVPGEASGCAA